MSRTPPNPPGGVLLHDAATGALTPIAEPPVRLVHAWAGRIVYIKPAGGMDTLHVADLKPAKE